jgi:hypothetical protein
LKKTIEAMVKFHTGSLVQLCNLKSTACNGKTAIVSPKQSLIYDRYDVELQDAVAVDSRREEGKEQWRNSS